MKPDRTITPVKRLGLLLIFLLTASLLSGCWDRQEIEERAVILGIGIDKADPKEQSGEPDLSHPRNKPPDTPTGLIKVTVQIAVPGRIPLGPGSGTVGGEAQNTVWIVDGVGHTLNDAINNLQQRIAPPLFFGHLRVIVVSETIARLGIQNLNEFLHRNPEIRRMNWMLICKGKAETLLKSSPQLERVPTLYLMTTMDQAVRMGRFPNMILGEFWSASSAKGQEGFLPFVTLKESGTMEISGLAYFRNDQMVGVTDPHEITQYMGLAGLNPAGGDRFVKLENTNEYVLLGARSRKSTIITELRNGKPHFNIEVAIEANIMEKSNNNVDLTPEIIRQLELDVEQNVKKSYDDLISKTKEKGSDIFGFGERVRSKQPKFWDKEVKTKENWQQMYKGITYDIKTNIHLRRVGMKSR
jgi:spore germination protein KC